MAEYYLIINNKTGGAPFYLPAALVGDTFVIGNISVSGLGLTTAGVTDSLDKRFVTDDELTALQSLTNLGVETLLASVPNVDLNSATPNSLYTVPAAKKAVITKVVIRNASISLDTASYSLGFNDPDYNNVIADATHTELTGATLYTILSAKAGAALGNAADVLKLLANTQQGAAATVTVDVYGYLV